LFYSQPPAEETVSDFFAATRISRRQARDAAVETLATVTGAQGASQEVIDAALDKISGIALTSTKEAELESLIMAKGFADCVVFISDDGVKVTVPAPLEGLAQASVAQITNIVTTETVYKAADMQIIEVK
jgi:stage III sporulation protein AH